MSVTFHDGPMAGVTSDVLKGTNLRAINLPYSDIHPDGCLGFGVHKYERNDEGLWMFTESAWDDVHSTSFGWHNPTTGESYVYPEFRDDDA